MNDDTNPAFTFSRTHTELLIKIASGEIDAQQLAKKELAGRGLDEKGEWAGFTKAAEIHGIAK